MSEINDPYAQRICTILGTDDIAVAKETIETYLDFMVKNLEKPVKLTGSEDFPWEERYVLGQDDKEEYEELKKENASYTDTFELMSFDGFEDPSGVFVNVRRESDNKEFSLPLADLKAVDKKSVNYKLLDDYSTWIVNYG